VLASDQLQIEIEIVNLQVLISIWEVQMNSLLNIVLPEKKMSIDKNKMLQFGFAISSLDLASDYV
jgi:hypothetical protein